jgi:hypothetical protein
VLEQIAQVKGTGRDDRKHERERDLHFGQPSYTGLDRKICKPAHAETAALLSEGRKEVR